MIQFFNNTGFIFGRNNSLLKFVDPVDIENDVNIKIQDFNMIAYPNPFNPETTISFSIPEDSNVELTIFNIRGQMVKTLVNSNLDKGNHSIIWNGDNESIEPVSSGVYFYKLIVNGKSESVKKCLLLK
ncbi:MAG: T9SS type A sorting domain-containing protein [Candidatus Cloacimonetes bacterium]|jgi:flagellar hook assembly protein FlgD|nr:T9SS type A sorting domain-containing protein [Candidatus Cloacimonadota bacterium]